MLKAQVSLYPAEQTQLKELTGLPTKFLEEHALDYDFHQSSTSFDTTITGSEEEVWSALRQLFQANSRKGQEVIMVTTLSHSD